MNKAHVDLRTGKIYNCEKGTWRWYHEQGHLKFNSNPKYSWLILLDQYIYDIIILSIITAFFIQNALIIAILGIGYHLFLMIFEENYCNQYANKKKGIEFVYEI